MNDVRRGVGVENVGVWDLDLVCGDGDGMDFFIFAARRRSLPSWRALYLIRAAVLCVETVAVLATTCTYPAPLGGRVRNKHDVAVVLAEVLIMNGCTPMDDSESSLASAGSALARPATMNGLGLWGADDALSKDGMLRIVLRRGVTLMAAGPGAGGFGAFGVGEGAGLAASNKSSHGSKLSLAFSLAGNMPLSKDSKLVGRAMVSPAAGSSMF